MKTIIVNSLTEQEREFIKKFRKLSLFHQQLILNMVLGTRKKKKK